jgi:UDP-N-acetylmuramyl pentapeptide phosphotransferase/UDP-N-acetylglucosamine-1-phosphate transferase
MIGFTISVGVTKIGLNEPVPWSTLLLPICMGLVGLIDDLISLGVKQRLAAQIVAGAIAGFSLDGELSGGVWGALLTPVVVNVVNFMDGINGITGLTVAAWATVAATIGLRDSSSPLVVLAGAALGSALAFLPWNVPRAKMFLGDSGSYFFGSVVAITLMTAREDFHTFWWVWAPLLVYFADTSFTAVRRAMRGAKLTAPHREHAYQRLVADAGWPHTRTAVLVAGLSLLIGFLSLSQSPPVAAVLAAIILSAYLALPQLLSKEEM